MLAAAGKAKDPSAWLVLALSPDRAGRLRINHDTVQQTHDWITRIRTVPFKFLVGALDVSSAFRSIQLTHTDRAADSRARGPLASVAGDGRGRRW